MLDFLAYRLVFTLYILYVLLHLDHLCLTADRTAITIGLIVRSDGGLLFSSYILIISDLAV